MSMRLRWMVLAAALSALASPLMAHAGSDGGGDWHGGDWDGGDWHHEWHGDHRHHHCHHHGHRYHGDHARPWHQGHAGLVGALHALELTDAQQQQVHAILSKAREQSKAERGGGAGSGAEAAVLANPGDPKYSEAVQAAKTRAAERIQRVSDLKLQLYNVLTPEQKSQYSKMIAARMQRPGGAPGKREGARGRPDPANR